MNFYLSCLLAFPKTKNGILGIWEFGTFYEVNPESWTQLKGSR